MTTSPGGGGPLRLKDWLLAQVESGQYPGLGWEDREQRLFRIPWKHASKQDYCQHEDAALFKAWAIHKGKFHEGLEKADPSAWKTRLRCALNKSADFREVPERSNLDISTPYKVYQVVSQAAPQETAGKVPFVGARQPAATVPQETGATCEPGKARTSSNLSKGDTGVALQASQNSKHSDYPGYQVRGVFCGWNPGQFRCHPSSRLSTPISWHRFNEKNINSDCWLHVRLYYSDVLVKEVTTDTPEGCRITYHPVAEDAEHVYGPSGIEQIQFPAPDVVAGKDQATRTIPILHQLLPHLHGGVLLWVAPDGVFMKRKCQGRVYWKGPLAPHKNQPNKLEREKTYKLLDTQQFLQQLRGYLSDGESPPQYQIHFCFGEEYPATPSQKLHKFIMAHVEPVFARDLFLHAQKLGPRSLQDSQLGNADAPGNFAWILKQLCLP